MKRAEVAKLAPKTLSPREIQVLRLRCAGLTNREIAADLGIAESTVKNHMGSVFLVSEARTGEQLALWAQRHGYLAPRDVVEGATAQPELRA